MNDINGNQPTPPPFDVWAVLDLWMRRWRWAAFWTVLLAVAGAWIARTVWSRSFSSTAQLIRYEPSTVDDSYRPRELAAPSLVVMLQAPGLLEEVGLQLHPALTAKELAKRLEITLDRNNDVVTVTATGRSKEESIATVNRYCAAAIAYTKTIQRLEATDVGDNLSRNLALVEADIASTRRAVPAESDPGLADFGQAAETQVGPSLHEQRLEAARDQLDDLLTRYTDAHPLVIEQRSRLAALESEGAVAGTGTAAKPAQPARSALSAPNLGLLYGRATPLEVAMSERVRDLETTRALLKARLRAIAPFRDNPPGYFRVLLSAAESPTQLQRYRLEVVLFACLGALVGILGSALLILVSEFMDNRIKTRFDVRRITGLPLLATLGNADKLSAREREQWAFRTWTALQSKLNVSTNHGMVCGITSARNGDGRSTWMGLLARAASSCGFRVLTITLQRSPELSDGDSSRGGPARQTKAPEKVQPDNLAGPDLLSAPGQIVERLNSAECPPVINISLPSWNWNLERRKQWRSALEAWQAVDHVVILVELPPAHVAESVLLAANIPNVLWLVDSGKSDATETLIDLETLRDASCNLVGAVFNREPAIPLGGRFSRWLGTSALALLLAVGIVPAKAQSAVTSTEPNAQSTGFSGSSPAQRAAWQQRLTLGPGDVLTFHLVGYPLLTRENVAVGPDGRVSYLEAKNLVAEGLTVDELRERLNAELGKFRRSPQAYVTPVAYHSKKYYMLGTVVTKGVFDLDHPITVIEAVARAHGFETATSQGDTVESTDFSHSFLTRGGKRIPVNFERLFMHGDLSQNVMLEPGDYLYFPATTSGEIYVLGQVGLPGPVAYDPDVSALSAIVSRGGFTERAWTARVLVLRGSLDRPVAYTVDVSRALTGDAPNLALQPGDLVYVSDRPWYRAEELLDHAASAFVESAVVTWTGLNVGPNIISRPNH